MKNNEVSLPDVEKISRLITVLSEYAVKSAREQWTQKMSFAYIAPRICCWDERTWLELTKDRQVVNYLFSDLTGAWILMRSLHFCLRYYGQVEIDRLQHMGMVIETNQEQNAVNVIKSSKDS